MRSLNRKETIVEAVVLAPTQACALRQKTTMGKKGPRGGKLKKNNIPRGNKDKREREPEVTPHGCMCVYVAV